MADGETAILAAIAGLTNQILAFQGMMARRSEVEEAKALALAASTDAKATALRLETELERRVARIHCDTCMDELAAQMVDKKTLRTYSGILVLFVPLLTAGVVALFNYWLQNQ